MDYLMYIAEKTLRAIEEKLVEDQGASFRQWQAKVFPHIGDAYRGEDDGFRSHLGASMIGRDCGRALWYGFHWAAKPKFPGKTLRLFNRGHLEEARFISLLLMIGVKVYQQDANGNQYRIEHAQGHFGGSGDGLALGIPDLPADLWSLLEFKTHGEKSFLELKKKGVKASKKDHFIQMQVYMRKMGLTVGLYLAVNKNTDELHGEIVQLEVETADQFLDRGERIVYLEDAPRKIAQTPGAFSCMFCEFKPICHSGGQVNANCRTCVFGRPNPHNSNWGCNFHKIELDKNAQLMGCGNYQFDKKAFT